MNRTTKELRYLAKRPFRLPKSAADLIPIDRVWEDGFFQNGKIFCKT